MIYDGTSLHLVGTNTSRLLYVHMSIMTCGYISIWSDLQTLAVRKALDDYKNNKRLLGHCFSFPTNDSSSGVIRPY